MLRRFTVLVLLAGFRLKELVKKYFLVANHSLILPGISSMVYLIASPAGCHSHAESSNVQFSILMATPATCNSDG